jgi:MFS family permease
MDQPADAAPVPGRRHRRPRLVPSNWILFRHGDFGRLWISQLQSNLGNWLMVVATPVFVFHLTGSPASTGLAFIAEASPALLLAPIAGVLVDRWNRRLIMVGSDVLRTLCALCMLLAAQESRVWIIYAAIFAENSFAQFFDPAYSAIIPAITGRGKELDEANAWSSASGGIVRLAGGPVGGLLYGLLGFRWLVIADSMTYLISAALVLSLAVAPSTRGERSSGPDGPTVSLRTRRMIVIADLREGITFLSGNAVLLSLLVVSSLFLLANGALSVIVVPFVVHVLHRGSQVVGLLMAALGAGFVLGSFIGRFLSRRGQLRLGTVSCLAALTAAFGGLFNSDQLGPALIFIALAGAPGGAFLLLVRVQIQRDTKDRMLGRVSSAFNAVQMTTTVIGAGLGAVLASSIGIVKMADAALVPLIISVVMAAIAVPGRRAVAEYERTAAIGPAGLAGDRVRGHVLLRRAGFQHRYGWRGR